MDKGIKPVFSCEVADVRVVVVGDEELRLALELLVDLTHKIEQDGVLVGVEVRFRVHTFRPFIGWVKENKATGAGGVGNNILIVTV